MGKNRGGVCPVVQPSCLCSPGGLRTEPWSRWTPRKECELREGATVSKISMSNTLPSSGAHHTGAMHCVSAEEMETQGGSALLFLPYLTLAVQPFWFGGVACIFCSAQTMIVIPYWVRL